MMHDEMILRLGYPLKRLGNFIFLRLRNCLVDMFGSSDVKLYGIIIITQG